MQFRELHLCNSLKRKSKRLKAANPRGSFVMNSKHRELKISLFCSPGEWN
jgi:hypothetical protein